MFQNDVSTVSYYPALFPLSIFSISAFFGLVCNYNLFFLVIVTLVIKSKITYIVNSRQVRVKNQILGVYKVTGAKILKKELTIIKFIKKNLYLVCKILKIQRIIQMPVSMAKLMPDDYFPSK